MRPQELPPESSDEHDVSVTSGDMLSARIVALNLLDDVLGRKNPLDQALENAAEFRTLPARDRSFCRMLVSTTLRRLGQVDDLIAKAEERPGNKTLLLQNILRLGVTQIMFMNVPDHAAVDTSVRIAESAGMERQKGFVNGLLRTIARIGKEWLARQDEGRLNTPDWLLKIWIDDYGLKTAAQIARANLAEAPLDITLRDEADRNYWASNLKASEVGNGTLRRIAGGPVHEIPGYDDGQWWVQDAAAAIPALLFGDIKGKTVIDLCAAPGGKSAQLAARGANVIAIDRSAQRLKKLEANLARLKLADRVQVIASDASSWQPKEPPQFILVDAPCTATGTIRRHPDVPHLKSMRDLESLVPTQMRILENAFNILAPGGVLVYCTCSLQKCEGEDQIQYLLSQHPNAAKIAITSKEIGDIADAVTENGDVRTLPFHLAASGGIDGFFISRITKAA
ncbi:MAG: methyltransferase domain-containing protein [Alphaproteobacteria bacterium PRO2]|nr:methyltransferase domain-containing protein [Alphaproteobacteria bacterium PRO2]